MKKRFLGITLLSILLLITEGLRIEAVLAFPTELSEISTDRLAAEEEKYLNKAISKNLANNREELLTTPATIPGKKLYNSKKILVAREIFPKVEESSNPLAATIQSDFAAAKSVLPTPVKHRPISQTEAEFIRQMSEKVSARNNKSQNKLALPAAVLPQPKAITSWQAPPTPRGAKVAASAILPPPPPQPVDSWQVAPIPRVAPVSASSPTPSWQARISSASSTYNPSSLSPKESVITENECSARVSNPTSQSWAARLQNRQESAKAKTNCNAPAPIRVEVASGRSWNSFLPKPAGVRTQYDSPSNPYLGIYTNSHRARSLMAQSPDNSYTPNPLSQRTALSPPELKFQGAFIYQGGEASARARVTGFYPLSPNAAFGTTVDLTDGSAFSDSRTEGLQLNELYFAIAPAEVPNLRFVVGQLDLTSYFDRNSFAKDATTHFFNSIFQTNSALSAAGIGSRQGVLVNLSLADNIEFKVAGFSSARAINDFRLDALAGEVGVRYGNAIIRGTYVTDRDAGINDGFREIFQIQRENGVLGLNPEDREEAYGVNFEYFIPQVNMGVFARYGEYNNLAVAEQGSTYNVGFNFLDLLAPSDRFGVAYGKALSNERRRRLEDSPIPSAFEVMYDFRFLSNLRLGFTFQALDDFSESILGFRVKTEFDLVNLRQ